MPVGRLKLRYMKHLQRNIVRVYYKLIKNKLCKLDSICCLVTTSSKLKNETVMATGERKTENYR